MKFSLNGQETLKCVL